MKERVICLHPLVRKGFNTDFDGDQMVVHVSLSSEACLLVFSHMNLLFPAIGDPIFILAQDKLMGLYVLTSRNCRGICANRYNPFNCRDFQNEKICVDANKDKYIKEPSFFFNFYVAIGAYHQKIINLESSLWFQWLLDQGLIASREAPIEGHFGSLGTYH